MTNPQRGGKQKNFHVVMAGFGFCGSDMKGRGRKVKIRRRLRYFFLSKVIFSLFGDSDGKKAVRMTTRLVRDDDDQEKCVKRNGRKGSRYPFVSSRRLDAIFFWLELLAGQRMCSMHGLHFGISLLSLLSRANLVITGSEIDVALSENCTRGAGCF